MPTSAQLASALGITFRQPLLLEMALTHRSFLNEHPERHNELSSNERLEFLGDAIVNMIAARLVYERFPDRGEGELTEVRAALVRTSALAQFARSLELGSYLRLSKGELRSGAQTRASLLADAFEALLGAIYLDQGLDEVQRIVAPLLEQHLATVAARSRQQNYRSRLQERMQSERNQTPHYVVVASSGPEHRREFTVEVEVSGEQLGRGRGQSKRAAAQAAAQDALERLDAAHPGRDQ
ncbi:MAG TPA: ribonuclease III [Roseiflexaceae bacterium]|nr:ribonuclease III [Roseiflexaceae bacterium]